MGDRSLRQQLVIDEMAGKNAAIHAYDHIIWVVRSGYLTLFFAGWALILKALIEAAPGDSVNTYIPMMVIMSAGLSIGGLVIDLNYILRKFRVIASLNRLMELAFKYGDSLDSLGNDEDDFMKALRVAGDSGKSSFGIPEGYQRAVVAAFIVYFTPFICLSIILKFGGF